MNRRLSSLARRRSVRVGLLALIAILVVAAGALAALSGQVGPALKLTGNGHLLHPQGKLTTVGDFPTGSALIPGGRYLWVADCGHGKDDIKVVDLTRSRVVQTLPLPGCYGGVAIAPDGRHAYVGGTPIGSSPTEGPTKGNDGDVIHVFTVDPRSGRGGELTPLTLPSTSGGSARSNSLPPVSGVGTEQPEGVAVSPNGRYLAVALNGADRAVIVDLQTMRQSLVSIGGYPNGAAFDPQGRAYISNEYDGTVSVIDPASATVLSTIHGLGGSLGDLNSHPQAMIADPHRPLLYVAVANRDLIAVIDTNRRAVTHLVSVGRPQGIGTQPVGLAISPDDGTLYAADSGEDAVAAISLSARPRARHPRTRRVYLPPSVRAITAYARALAHRPRRETRGQDSRRRGILAARYLRVHVVRACSGPTLRQEGSYVRAVLAALRRQGHARTVALARAQHRLPVRGGCAVGYIPGLPALRLIGRLPTAAYPDSVQTTSRGQLVWIAGKGFGSGPNPTYYFGGAKTPFQTPANAYGTYVLDLLIGRVGTLPLPTDRQVAAATRTADAQAVPSNAAPAPAGSPIPASTGHPSAQIKHVFYIVKENRTYDQLFGSDPRGDGNKQLELFDDNGVAGPTGGITPNAHALTHQFPLLDHFYEDSEVSVDGHLIAAGAVATDYAQKATAANYSNRRGTYDFGIYPVSFPARFFLFDQAAKQNVSFRDFGEDVGAIPLGAAPNRPDYARVQAALDPTYPGNLQIGCIKAGVPATCTQDSGLYNGTGQIVQPNSRFNVWYPEFQTEVATNSVPALNVLILPSDHTNGTTPKDPTPQAMIADNDLALGQMVDAISHSSIWSSSAIFVVEDDSQDGADHVDSHRSPGYVISPWTRHGAVVPTRYDQYSMLRTLELILGLQPLALTDALATPMYDAFISGNQKPDNTPYTVKVPGYPISAVNTASAADAKLSAELPWNRLDAVPQEISDEILWASVHGAGSAAPAPGPNASPDEHDRALIVRSLLKASPNAFRQTQAAAAARAPAARASGSGPVKVANCPISWACQPAPPGEG